jgi:hypothetical protein
MTIYQLLYVLIKSASRSGQLSRDDALAGVDLVKRLEALNAFGTMATITKGEHK